MRAKGDISVVHVVHQNTIRAVEWVQTHDHHVRTAECRKGYSEQVRGIGYEVKINGEGNGRIPTRYSESFLEQTPTEKNRETPQRRQSTIKESKSGPPWT